MSIIQRRRLERRRNKPQQLENNKHTSNIGRVNTSFLHSAEKWRIYRRQTSFMPPPNHHPFPDKFRDKSSICSCCSLRLSGTSGTAANQSFHGGGGEEEEEEPSSALLNPPGLPVWRATGAAAAEAPLPAAHLPVATCRRAEQPRPQTTRQPCLGGGAPP